MRVIPSIRKNGQPNLSLARQLHMSSKSNHRRGASTHQQLFVLLCSWAATSVTGAKSAAQMTRAPKLPTHRQLLAAAQIHALQREYTGGAGRSTLRLSCKGVAAIAVVAGQQRHGGLRLRRRQTGEAVAWHGTGAAHSSVVLAAAQATQVQIHAALAALQQAPQPTLVPSRLARAAAAEERSPSQFAPLGSSCCSRRGTCSWQLACAAPCRPGMAVWGERQWWGMRVEGRQAPLIHRPGVSLCVQANPAFCH